MFQKYVYAKSKGKFSIFFLKKKENNDINQKIFPLALFFCK